jgi:hypothetical protein
MISAKVGHNPCKKNPLGQVLADTIYSWIRIQRKLQDKWYMNNVARKSIDIQMDFAQNDKSANWFAMRVQVHRAKRSRLDFFFFHPAAAGLAVDQNFGRDMPWKSKRF